MRRPATHSTAGTTPSAASAGAGTSRTTTTSTAAITPSAASGTGTGASITPRQSRRGPVTLGNTVVPSLHSRKTDPPPAAKAQRSSKLAVRLKDIPSSQEDHPGPLKLDFENGKFEDFVERQDMFARLSVAFSEKKK